MVVEEYPTLVEEYPNPPKYRAKVFVVVPSANVELPHDTVVASLTNQPIVSASRYARRIKEESKI